MTDSSDMLRRRIDDVKQMSKEEKLAFFRSVGIIDENGRLTEKYADRPTKPAKRQ